MRAKQKMRVEKMANDYAGSCDNESGSFLQSQLFCIRKNACLFGYNVAADKSQTLIDALKLIYRSGDKLSSGIAKTAIQKWEEIQ